MHNKSLTKKRKASILSLNDRNSDSAPAFCINGPGIGFGSVHTDEILSPLQCTQLTCRLQFSYRNVVANEAETLDHLMTSSLVLCQSGGDFRAQGTRIVGQKTNVSCRNV